MDAETVEPIQLPSGKEYRPHPRQQAFHESTARYRCLSGAFGSGKTLPLCVEAIKLSLSYPGNVGLIGRQTWPALRDTTLNTLFKVLNPVLVANYDKTAHRLDLVNGSQIYFRPFDDPLKLGSFNLGWFAIDEAIEVSEETFRMLRGRLRLETVKDHYGFLATNPEARSHWVFQTFIEPKEDRDKDYAVFESSTLENVQNLPDEYVKDLRKLEGEDADYYARYVLGKWGQFSGLVYKEFDRGLHVTNNLPSGVVTYYGGLDFGYENPGCYHIIGIDGDDIAWNVCEVFATHMLIEDPQNPSQSWAEFMLEAQRIWPVRTIWADPSRPEHIKVLQDRGLPAEKANNDVSLGIQAVKRRLRMRGDGQPGYRIHSSCVNNIREKGLYRWDPKRTDKVLKQDDHSQDAERYCFAGIDGVGRRQIGIGV